MVPTSIEEAVDYIKGQVKRFFDSIGELRAMRREAVTLVWNHIEVNVDATPAYSLLNQIDSLMFDWKSIGRKLKPFTDYFNIPAPSGLGILLTLPLLLTATAIGLAGAMFLYFKRLTNTRLELENTKTKLDLIRRDKVSPEILEDQGPLEKVIGKASTLVGNFSNLGLILIGGVALFAFMKK